MRRETRMKKTFLFVNKNNKVVIIVFEIGDGHATLRHFYKSRIKDKYHRIGGKYLLKIGKILISMFFLVFFYSSCFFLHLSNNAALRLNFWSY